MLVSRGTTVLPVRIRQRRKHPPCSAVVGAIVDAHPQNRVPTQARFALQNVQRDLQQPLPQMFSGNTAILIPHQRRQQGADILTLPARERRIELWPCDAVFQNHDQWLNSGAWDTHSGKEYSIRLLGTEADEGKVEVKCYRNILETYREHPVAKFLGHDSNPCNSLTRGLLTRRHIIASRHRYIGKETSRRWEHGGRLNHGGLCLCGISPRANGRE